jgi:ureidoglycolate dehydrogenase (NAD+)
LLGFEMNFEYTEILGFTNALLKKVGLSEHSRESVAEGLCNASLRGVDSHGIRLLPHYVNSAVSGRKNGNPKYQIFETYPSAIALDADNAFGLAAGRYAVEQAILRANKTGSCIVSVRNSSHPGAMASSALFAAYKGYLCFAFTNADSLVLSTNGIRPFFGTNPVCFAAPRRGEEPFCVDMAVSKVPWNKVLLHKSNGETLPDNVVADSKGNRTNDPNLAASLFPVGDYKGYALAAMVEVLCGVLSGEPFGRDIPPMYKASMAKGRRLAQFYMVFKPDISISMDRYLDHIAAFTKVVRSEPASDRNGVMLPNDPQIAAAERRLRQGIPIDHVTLNDLLKIAGNYEIEFPTQM